MRFEAHLAWRVLVLFVATSNFADGHDSSSQDVAVYSYRGGPSPVSVAEQCYSIRRQLHARWSGDRALQPWKPRCRIVVHATRAGYLNAVGRGAAQTSGSSLIRFDGSRIVERRIDLLADGGGELPALAHELTHVVLADRFGGRQPPHWADEGIALLSDSAEKQALHRRDCQLALRSGRALRLAEIVRLERFTSGEEAAAFYGQSLSLVDFLVRQAGPARFLAFVETGMDNGYDRALRQCYDIDGLGALECQWHEAATHYSANATLLCQTQPSSLRPSTSTLDPSQPSITLVTLNFVPSPITPTVFAPFMSFTPSPFTITVSPAWIRVGSYEKRR